jgi:hypothetical protein
METYYELTKLSGEGFVFEGTEAEVKEKLFSYICEQCRCEEGLTKDSSLHHMMDSLCGAEFWLGHSTWMEP